MVQVYEASAWLQCLLRLLHLWFCGLLFTILWGAAGWHSYFFNRCPPLPYSILINRPKGGWMYCTLVGWVSTLLLMQDNGESHLNENIMSELDWKFWRSFHRVLSSWSKTNSPMSRKLPCCFIPLGCNVRRRKLELKAITSTNTKLCSSSWQPGGVALPRSWWRQYGKMYCFIMTPLAERNPVRKILVGRDMLFDTSSRYTRMKHW